MTGNRPTRREAGVLVGYVATVIITYAILSIVTAHHAPVTEAMACQPYGVRYCETHAGVNCLEPEGTRR